jgi:gluconate 2-dehydrogenase alpha chain
LNTFSGTASQGVAIDDFDSPDVDPARNGYLGGGMLAAVMEVRPIQLARNVPPSVPRWGLAWRRWLAAHGNAIGMVILSAEQLPYERNFFDLDPSAVDDAGIPRVRWTYDLTENDRRAFDGLEAALHRWLAAAGASDSWIPEPGPLAVSTHAYGGDSHGNRPGDERRGSTRYGA